MIGTDGLEKESGKTMLGALLDDNIYARLEVKQNKKNNIKSININLESFCSFLRKKSEQLSEESLPNLTDSDNPLNHQRSTSKESRGNSTVRKYL